MTEPCAAGLALSSPPHQHPAAVVGTGWCLVDVCVRLVIGCSSSEHFTNYKGCLADHPGSRIELCCRQQPPQVCVPPSAVQAAWAAATWAGVASMCCPHRPQKWLALMSDGFTQITLWCSSPSSCLASRLLYRASGFCRQFQWRKGQRAQERAQESGQTAPRSEGTGVTEGPRVRGHEDQSAGASQRQLSFCSTRN